MAIDSEIAEEFAALGVQIEAEEIDEDANAVQIWDVNQDAVWLFLDLETQWRCAVSLGGVHWLGLDYIAADVLMRTRFGRKRRRQLFEDLRLMEREALTTFAKLKDVD